MSYGLICPNCGHQTNCSPLTFFECERCRFGQREKSQLFAGFIDDREYNRLMWESYERIEVRKLCKVDWR